MSKKNSLDLLPAVWKSSVLLCNVMQRIVSERMAEEMNRADFGVGLREAWVMMCAQEVATSQTTIADCLGINPNVMVGVIDSLEGKGLARRQRAENRREYRIELTSQGRATLIRLMEDIQHRSLRVFSPLTQDELDSFVQLARSVIENSRRAPVLPRVELPTVTTPS